MKIAFCVFAVVAAAVALPADVHFEIPELDLSKVTSKNIYVEPINPLEAIELPESRIIGGQEVAPNSVPYQVAVLINGNNLCGGSLITASHVLTAAHCTISASFVQVRLGAHNFNTNEATQVRITSTNVVNHADYNVGSFVANDISIVFLPDVVSLNVNIQTVPLAPTDAGSYEGSTAFLAGWGRTTDASSASSPVLLGVNLNVISNAVCRAIYGSIIIDSTLCTSGSGTVGACTGDSGGPLVVDGVQVGVVSFSGANCEAGNPSGYAKVSSFRNWIEEHIGSIIGGHEVVPNSVPSQVALLVNGVSLCGGSLVTTTQVLTAAHCTIETSYVQVRLGAHRFNQIGSTQVRLTSTSVVNHADYIYGSSIANDIAVLLLPDVVSLDANIQTIPLAPADAGSYASSRAFLGGWGRTTDESNAISPVLLGVDLHVISNAECRAVYGNAVVDSNICTSGSGFVGACNGDPGGPLVVDGVQVGIVSFGSSSCERGAPTGYVRISSFSNWIHEYIGA